VIEAAILAAWTPIANGRRYIVTDDQAFSVRELYEAICQALAKQIPRWHFPLGALRLSATLGDWMGRLGRKRAPFDSNALAKMIEPDLYSCKKIAKDLGYRPSMTFENALPKIIDWYCQAKP